MTRAFLIGRNEQSRYLEISHETAAGRGRHRESKMLNMLIERCCSLRDSVAGTFEGKDLSCCGNGEVSSKWWHKGA